MYFGLLNPVYQILNSSCDNKCVSRYLKKIEIFLNERYEDKIPNKYFFFKQHISAHMMSNTIVIDFPEGMQIPKDIRDFLSDYDFYYTVFFYYFNGKSKILIKNCKKGACLYEHD